jgi:hypothetical protein
MELSKTKQKAERRRAKARVAKKERNQLARKVKQMAREATRAPAVHLDPPKKPVKTATQRKERARAGERWARRGPTARVQTGPNTSIVVSANRKARRTAVAQARARAAALRAAVRRAEARAAKEETAEAARLRQQELADGVE